jgi:hypothetical protein
MKWCEVSLKTQFHVQHQIQTANKTLQNKITLY